ncbi:MAG: hypothetical protein P8Y12_02145, partial [Gammaproteobacteria bacterium]
LRDLSWEALMPVEENRCVRRIVDVEKVSLELGCSYRINLVSANQFVTIDESNWFREGRDG